MDKTKTSGKKNKNKKLWRADLPPRREVSQALHMFREKMGSFSNSTFLLSSRQPTNGQSKKLRSNAAGACKLKDAREAKHRREHYQCRFYFGIHERNPTYPYQSHLHQRSSTYEKSPASLI